MIIKETAIAVSIAAAIALACGTVVILPFWMSGKAKSAWLDETQGINLPWYSTVMLERDVVYPPTK